MASPTAVGSVSTAAIAKLQASTALTTVVSVDRISDEIQARMAYPYVLVESSGERPFNTLGAFGSIAGLRVRIFSQYRGDAEAAGILAAVKGCLDDQPMVVSGYPSVSVEFQSLTPLRDFGAVVTREWIADFDVRVHQT